MKLEFCLTCGVEFIPTMFPPECFCSKCLITKPDPCPFCGSDDIEDFLDVSIAYCECRNCGARGPDCMYTSPYQGIWSWNSMVKKLKKNKIELRKRRKEKRKDIV